MSTQPINPLAHASTDGASTDAAGAAGIPTAEGGSSWDTSGVTTSGNQFARPVNLQPACMNLRHKLMYCDDRHARLGVVDASSDTRVFLCVRTGDGLGPDDQPVHPQECCANRVCFKAPHGMTAPTTDSGPAI